jgi:hypothetical protein
LEIGNWKLDESRDFAINIAALDIENFLLWLKVNGLAIEAPLKVGFCSL